jgi:hypothetical protein
MICQSPPSEGACAKDDLRQQGRCWDPRDLSENGSVREKRGQMRARVQEVALLQGLAKRATLRFNV